MKTKIRPKNSEDGCSEVASLLSLTASSLSCVAFVSFSLANLPTNRNLLTYIDTVLVIALTSAANIAVRVT